MDWNDLRDFLAIARHGTLSGAAAVLAVRQSTMGRRLKALEGRLGARLLQKTPSGFIPTAAGLSILERVERIEHEALAVERAIAGKDVRLEGKVRLTAVEGLTVEVLAPIIADFHTRYPAITIEMIADESLSLVAGEVDVALRMTRFPQNDLTVRKVGDFAFGVYASSAYLARRGIPDFARGAAGHLVLLPQEAMNDSPQGAWFTAFTGDARVVLRTNTFYMLVAAAESGMGIAALPRFLGDAAKLARLDMPSEAPLRELWLGMHSDMRDVPRFRAVADFVAAGLRRNARRLNPDTSVERADRRDSA